jgi:excisionase family DNA binding protein
MEQKVLTVGEVAKELRLNRPDAVYRLIRSGRLRAAGAPVPMKPYRIPREALDRFISGEPQKPAKPKHWLDGVKRVVNV